LTFNSELNVDGTHDKLWYLVTSASIRYWSRSAWDGGDNGSGSIDAWTAMRSVTIQYERMGKSAGIYNASGGYRLYSRKVDLKTGKRRNLGAFHTREEAQKHERAVQYFKRLPAGR
jgi:hypothetical protein